MAKMPMPFSNPMTYAGHSGVDWPQPSGTPIPAITDGTVTFLGWWGYNTPQGPAGGITRTITRSDGLQIMHCHLLNMNGPQVGAKVSYAQTIGYVGSTGHSTGPHLHIEMWKAGVPQDEWAWMDRNNWVGKGSTAGGGGDIGPIVPGGKAGEVFIAVRKGSWYLMTPSGGGLYATVLGGQDKRSGTPFSIVEFVWDTSWNSFKSQVVNRNILPS